MVNRTLPYLRAAHEFQEDLAKQAEQEMSTARDDVAWIDAANRLQKAEREINVLRLLIEKAGQ